MSLETHLDQIHRADYKYLYWLGIHSAVTGYSAGAGYSAVTGCARGAGYSAVTGYSAVAGYSAEWVPGGPLNRWQGGACRGGCLHRHADTHAPQLHSSES